MMRRVRRLHFDDILSRIPSRGFSIANLQRDFPPRVVDDNARHWESAAACLLHNHLVLRDDGQRRQAHDQSDRSSYHSIRDPPGSCHGRH
jgi:hypothetical protein